MSLKVVSTFARWLAPAFFAALISCGGSSDAPRPSILSATPEAANSRDRAAAPATSLQRMRAVHAMGRWGGNVRGFASPLLNEAPTAAVQRVTVATSRGSFVDNQGITQTNDLAQVTLEGVQLGSGRSVARAGFWVYRSTRTGDSGIQFRPQLDSNLAGIDGFNGDVNIAVPAVGSTTAPDLTAVRGLTGTARALVLAVLAQGGALVRSGSYTVTGGAEFGDMATLSATLDRVTSLLDTDKAYFDYLASMNVEWIGISVAMHHDNISTGEIVTRGCAADVFNFPDSNGVGTACTFADADLQSFVARARARGFRIYLTLAFETSATPPENSPACGTSNYKVARYWLGIPELPAGTAPTKCVSANNWWWNPTHPDHTRKVAQFWDSYQQIATRYAAMAQAMGVEIFSLGTETEALFRTRSGTGVYTNHFLPQLQSMVQAVRQVFSGWVTYDQHSTQLLHPEWFGGDQSVHYVFADLGLDLVGISAYFELVATPPNRVLSVTELEAAWETIFNNALKPLQSRNPGKPIVFLEFGVVDHVNAPYDQQFGAEQPEPPFDAAHPTDGMLQQRNVYQALFNVNARYADLVSGFFFWGHDYLPYNNYTCKLIDWGTSCRPARQVLTTEYARWKALDQATVTPSAQHSGWWWNGTEPGRGYFVEVVNGRYFAAAFLYDAAGAPLWYVMGPGAVASTGISSTFDRYTGGQTLTGAYKPATGPVASGDVTIAFSGSSSGTLRWGGGSIALTRYEISTGSLSAAAPAFRPETGWWWNAAEGGRGFALEVQGDAFFIAGFMYGPAGEPMWYVSGGRVSTPNRLDGTWQSCANGQALGAAFRPTTCTNLANGSMQLVFSDARNGVLTLPDGRPVALSRFTF